MSTYLTEIQQEDDIRHCHLVPDPDWIDPDDGSEQPIVCKHPHQKLPKNIIKTGEFNGKNIYLSIQPISSGISIGGWNNNGGIIVPVVSGYNQLVPVGNAQRKNEDGEIVETGLATGPISYANWQGLNIRHRQEISGRPEYPEHEQPIELKIVRIQEDGKFGFQVIVMSEDADRDIRQRRIGIFDVMGENQYYTVNFALREIEEGVDEDGNPIIVERFVAQTPPGQLTDDPSTYTYALMHGNNQEGRWTLSNLDLDASATKFFWKYEQGQSGVLDIDRDGLPDTTLMGKHMEAGHVTEDTDSINYDMTGDGSADYVLPK